MRRVGLVGIGGMGFVHYNAYKTLDNAKIVAVADPRVEMAKEKIGEDDVRVYASMEEMLRSEELDMVDICTPSYMHADMAIMAMESGLDVLCEKPMSLNSENTARMIEAHKRTGKAYMTAHVVRFMKPYMYLKSVIDSGELGKPVHIQMKRISGIPRWSWEDWMRDTNKSGGAAIDLSIHDIDFVQYVFGQPKEVSGTHMCMKDNNDYLESELIYDGFSVSIIGGWYNAEIPFDASYMAIFENGFVKSEGGVVVKCNEKIDLDLEKAKSNTGINLSSVDGYAGEIAYFVNCLDAGVPSVMVTPESSQDSIKLAERILAAAKKV